MYKPLLVKCLRRLAHLVTLCLARKIKRYCNATAHTRGRYAQAEKGQAIEIVRLHKHGGLIFIPQYIARTIQ